LKKSGREKAHRDPGKRNLETKTKKEKMKIRGKTKKKESEIATKKKSERTYL